MSAPGDSSHQQTTVVTVNGQLLTVQLAELSASGLEHTAAQVTHPAETVLIHESHDVSHSKVFSLIQATLASDVMSAIAAISWEMLCSAAEACSLKLLYDVSTGVYITVGSSLDSFHQLEQILLSLLAGLMSSRLADKSAQDVAIEEMPVSLSASPAVCSTVTSSASIPQVPSVSASASRQSDLTAVSELSHVDELLPDVEPQDKSTCPKQDFNLPQATPTMSEVQSSVEQESGVVASACQHRTRSGRQVKIRNNDEFYAPETGVPRSVTSSKCDKSTTKNSHAHLRKLVESSGGDLQDTTNKACETDAAQQQAEATVQGMKDRSAEVSVSSLYNGRTRLESREYEQLTPYQYFCTQCSFKSKRVGQLQKHVELHARGVPVLKCPQCSYRTTRSNHLTTHRLREHGGSAVTCSVAGCQYIAASADRLASHMKSRHSKPSEIEYFPCPVSGCGYRALTKTRLVRHRARHRAVDGQSSNSDLVDRYRCTQCSYETSQRERFQRHVDSVHSNIRPYLCDICGRTFKRPNALQQHYIVHYDKESLTHYRAHQCNVCKRTFRSKSHLTNHEAMHSNSRSFACDICHATFKTRTVQRKHVLTIHSQPAAHVCPSCGRTFNTQYTMHRHSRMHQLQMNTVDIAAVSSQQTSFYAVTGLDVCRT